MAGGSEGAVDETAEGFGGGKNVEDFAEEDRDVERGVAITLDGLQFELSIGASSSLFFDGNSLPVLLVLLMLLLLTSRGAAGGACGGCEGSEAG